MITVLYDIIVFKTPAKEIRFDRVAACPFAGLWELENEECLLILVATVFAANAALSTEEASYRYVRTVYDTAAAKASYVQD